MNFQCSRCTTDTDRYREEYKGLDGDIEFRSPDCITVKEVLLI